MSNEPESTPQDGHANRWERLASELRACKESQRRTWGDLDDDTLGRYLAGESSDEETALVEVELHGRPELRKLTDLVRDVLGDLEPAAPVAPPRLLSFEQARAKRRPVLDMLRRRSALLAAACLLVVLGVALPKSGFLSAPLDNALNSPSNGLTLSSKSPRVTDELPVAEALLREADELRQRGELVAAEEKLAKSYQFCKAKLGEEHQATKRSVTFLADVYAAGLNAAPAEVKVVRADAMAASGTTESIKLHKPQSDANPMYLWFSNQRVGEIKRQVVPVLTTAMAQSTTVEKRRMYVQALGNLGPVARAAVPALAARLDQATDTAEIKDVLLALERMGEAANPALPVLARICVDDAKKACFTPTAQALALQVSRQLQGAEGRVGIHDAAGCFSFGVLRNSYKELADLAQKQKVEVFVVTGTKEPDHAAKSLEHMGPRAVLVAIDTKTPSVQVLLSEQLKKDGFDGEPLRQKILDFCRDHKFDQGLVAGVQIIRTRAERHKK